MTDDERAIRNLITSWMAASRTGDTQRLLSLMADDVIFMTPGREPFGKAEFEALSKTMRSTRVEGTCDIREIAVRGDWAYIRNYIEVAVPLAGSDRTHRAGYTLSILRKEPDGRWLLVRDANLVM